MKVTLDRHATTEPKAIRAIKDALELNRFDARILYLNRPSRISVTTAQLRTLIEGGWRFPGVSRWDLDPDDPID